MEGEISVTRVTRHVPSVYVHGLPGDAQSGFPLFKIIFAIIRQSFAFKSSEGGPTIVTTWEHVPGSQKRLLALFQAAVEKIGGWRGAHHGANREGPEGQQ